MPYIKGVVHEVDFKSMLSELGVPYIIDLWGNEHKVCDVDLILTKSMFKGYGWLTENGMSFEEYLDRCCKYRHALYISGVNQTDKQEFTELNYQFLTIFYSDFLKLIKASKARDFLRGLLPKR